MALTLRVTSFHSQALGAQGVKTFGAGGGTIGRKPDNDWVLPDPERFISGRHAEIDCRNGAYYLRDLSVNGTFVNGSPQPVGSGAEYALGDGDRLQIGEYEITVSLDAAEQSDITGPTGFDMRPGGAFQTGPSSPSTGTGPYGPGTGPTGSQGFGGQDLGQPSSVDPLDFFGDNSAPQQSPAAGAQSDHASSLEDYYRPPAVEPPPQPPPSNPPSGGTETLGGIPEDWDKTGYSPSGSYPEQDFGASMPPQAPQAPPPQPPPPTGPAPSGPAPTAAPPATGDAASMLAAILQAAGLDAAQARQAVASPDLANNLGLVLGVVVQGMVEVLKGRSEIKSQFRVPVTMMRPVENNPLKFSATPAQALHTLLDAQSHQAYLGPVQAIAEGFQDIKAHQVAMMAGMRAAFDSMIKRFDPEELAQRFEKRLKRGALLSMPGKGRYWDMYRDLYEEWTQDADVNFQRLFGDEFARAYEEQMRRLTSAKR